MSITQGEITNIAQGVALPIGTREKQQHNSCSHSTLIRYVCEMLKMLPEMPEAILLTQIFAKLTFLGRIHPVSMGVEPS